MGFWEKVLPGYKGYREREDSRNTDALLRDFLAKKLKEGRAQFDEVKAAIAKRGELDLLDPAEKVTQTLSRVIDRLRYANYGFSGKWFGKDKIDVERLEKVHAFDQQTATRVEQGLKEIAELERIEDAGQMKAGLLGLIQTVKELDAALNEREQILRAAGGQGEVQE
jgi:hypothetical protein